MGLVSGIAKAGKGVAKAATGQGPLARAAGLGNGKALGKIAEVGKGALQAVGGPQGVVDIVNQSIQMGNQQAAAITGDIVSILQGLMVNRPAN